MNLQKTSGNNLKVNAVSNRLTTALFIIYLIGLCWILLFKLGVQFSYMGNRSVNLVPFREALFRNGRLDIAETVLNVMIFVPPGIYVGILFDKWNFGRKVFFLFLISLIVEGL